MYGSPLDPVLFAIDPPQLAKVGANSTPTSYASVTTYSSMTGFSTHSTTGMGSSSANTGNTGKVYATVTQIEEIAHTTHRALRLTSSCSKRWNFMTAVFYWVTLIANVIISYFHHKPIGTHVVDCLFYTGVSAGQDEPDLRDLMLLGSTGGTGNSSSKSSGSSNSSAVQHVCGLLEVEPLHFVCHATSDGTRMERMDTGIAKLCFCNVLSSVRP